MSYYNPLDKFYKSNMGAVCDNVDTIFRVRTDSENCVLTVITDKTNSKTEFLMTKKDGYFECSVKISVGLYWYYFDLRNGHFIGLGDNFNGIITDDPRCFQLTVYSNDYKVPDWLSGGIIYQIFPDRFCSSGKKKKLDGNRILHDSWDELPVYIPNEKGHILNNDFFGGDIQGIISKLEYLKELNVTAIYLNPIFKAYSNHRYDTGNYLRIDELLGTETDFKQLISKAKELGISIILDGVFNHVGSDSIYFNRYGKYSEIGAFQSKESKYYSWFKFKNYPDDYHSWWGIKTLPAVDKNNKDFIEYITGEDGVLEHYTKLGIGGWRLDVVDELPDKFVRNIRKAVKKCNKDAIIIGEVWEDASNKVAYGKRREYFQGKELDSVMNYPLKNAILNYADNGTEHEISYCVKEQLDHYPKQVLDSLMNILSTHDTYRLISAFDYQSVANKTQNFMSKRTLSGKILNEIKLKMRIATLLQFTLCGVPSIYYGEEIGMQGYKDPLNRQTFKWDNIDKGVYDWYKLLSDIRSNYDVFKKGEYREVYAGKGVFAFERFNDDYGVFVCVNNGVYHFDLEFSGKLYNLLDDNTYDKTMSLPPKTMCILINAE